MERPTICRPCNDSASAACRYRCHRTAFSGQFSPSRWSRTGEGIEFGEWHCDVGRRKPQTAKSAARPSQRTALAGLAIRQFCEERQAAGWIAGGQLGFDVLSRLSLSVAVALAFAIDGGHEHAAAGRYRAAFGYELGGRFRFSSLVSVCWLCSGEARLIR